jgi:P63C domain
MFKQGQQQQLLKDQIKGPLVEKAQYRAKHGSPDKPMNLGGILIDCYTLEHGATLITELGMYRALGISRGGENPATRAQQKQGVNHCARLATLATHFATLSSDSAKLTTAPDLPIQELVAHFKPFTFVLPQGGAVAHGYRATCLAKICAWALKAMSKGRLTPRYHKLGRRAAVMIEAFSEAGIVALVHEHTGYVPQRGLVLAADIRVSELTNSVHRLGLEDFYRAVHKVWGWEWKGSNHSTPYMGKLVMDLIYRRLPHGVLDRMEQVNPRGEDGQRKNLMYRNLTDDVGIPEVRKLINDATKILQAAESKAQAMRFMDAILPRSEGLLFDSTPAVDN